MTELHVDDALNFLISELAALPEVKPGMMPGHGRRPYGSDIWISQIVEKFWLTQGIRIRDLPGTQNEEPAKPFYDAAWELCRRGVLRPGQVAPLGMASSGYFAGDGYALTKWGEQWVKKTAVERGQVPVDPGRLGEILLDYKKSFGDGYAQRSLEAISDYRAGNYLSTCVMAGAAAESILLATAIAKTKDEGKVLAEYRTASGRTRVIKNITGNAPKPIAERFSDALGILNYWRDDAGHGMASTISEIEAHEALSRLLRLAQFTSDHWAVLTK